MRTLLQSIAACAILGLSSASATAPPGQEQGFAAAYVVHVMTGEPLAGMPVVVQQVIGPDGGTARVYITGRDGVAVIGPLESGLYVAYVSYNNNESQAVRFQIDGRVDSVTTFTLYFNPDVDPS